jgi:hypothetical protein
MRKRFIGLLIVLLAFGLALVGCPNNSTDDPSGDSVWLADLSNPFIGKWESDIPSANMHLIFDYKTDGTFDYEIPGMSAEEGGKGTGGYVVIGDIMVTYLDFEGVAGYTFKVIDNDTIDVTEIEEVKEDGSFELGNTTPFTRIAGSPVNKEDKPFVLSNPYLGKWKFDSDVPIPPDNSLVHYLVVFEMRTDGVMKVDYDVTGGPKGSETEGYFIYNNGTSDLLVLFEEDAGFSAELIAFISDDTIIVNYEGMPLPCTRIPYNDDAIKISTAAQFDAIRDNLDGHYVLEADINLSGYTNWEPIGQFVPKSDAPEDAETPKLELAFTGVFDGNGHKISNVTINAPETAGVGLFGCVAGDDGVVKNLVVENATVSGMMLVSGVIGYAASENPIENIILQGTNTIIGSYTMVGGIVGGGFGDIKNCSANAAITVAENGEGAVGVITGGMEDGSIVSCSATGIVTAGSGNGGIGGLAGCYLNAPEIKDCAVDVTITVGENCTMIGGLVGFTGNTDENPTIISGCTAKAVISAPASAERIGGIVGSGMYVPAYASYYPKPTAFIIRNSSSSGSITGGCTDLVGKIAGYVYDNSTVENTCTSTMTGASNNVGGDKNSAGLETLS